MRSHEHDYEPATLDILARAYDRALNALPTQDAADRQAMRVAVLNGILDAADRGILSEEALTESALEGVGRVAS